MYYFEDFKNKQKIKSLNNSNFEDEKCYIAGEFHDYFRRIPFQRLKRLLNKLNLNLENKKLHIASCGTGIDVYYINKLVTEKSKIFVSDYSEQAVNATLKINSSIVTKGQVEDNESLSFSDNFFDYSLIAASLHHLPRPHLGLFELLRVSREGVIVIEPNDSLLTRIATKLKFAQEFENVGNYVFRYSKRDVEKISKSLFYKYYAVRFFATHKVVNNSFEFLLLKIVNNLLNNLIPSQGNYIIFIIQKKMSPRLEAL